MGSGSKKSSSKSNIIIIEDPNYSRSSSTHSHSSSGSSNYYSSSRHGASSYHSSSHRGDYSMPRSGYNSRSSGSSGSVTNEYRSYHAQGHVATYTDHGKVRVYNEKARAYDPHDPHPEYRVVDATKSRSKSKGHHY